MRIDDSSRNQSQLNALQYHSERAFQLQQEIASGSRVNKPSDNPGLYQLKDDLQQRVSQLQAGQRFLAEQSNRLNHYDAMVGGLTDNLRTARSLIQRASNAATDPGALPGLQQEMNRLIESSLSLVNSEVGGRHLFAGTRVEQAPFVAQTVAGAVSSVTYQGDASFPGVPLPDGRRLQVALDGRSLVEGPGSNFFQSLIDLRDALTGPTVEAEPHMTRLAQWEDHLGLRRADAGAASRYLTQIESRQKAQEMQARQELATSVESNLPESITHLLQHETAQQASYATISRLARLSLVDFLR